MSSPERKRSASPAPAKERQDRTRSPPRHPKKHSGFKWKSKKDRLDDEEERPRDHEADSYKPKRYGGRDDRDRRDRRDWRNDDGDAKDGRPDRADDKRFDRRHRNDSRERNPDDKFGPERERPKPKPKAKEPAPKPAPVSMTFIMVTVNDRLGTKARIPCLPNDTVGDFKKLVAAQIGRKPHEIMLKRQGEKPFKDHITLGDYGINNGVQLDLELGTGD
jgi:hypothetical protein